MSKIKSATWDMVLYPANPVLDIPALLVFWLLASWPWLSGINLIPHDSITFFYPQSQFIVDSIRAGDWPWWNPYQFSGLPVLGDPQGMLLTLHSLVGLLLGGSYTLDVFDKVTLLQILIGAIFVYIIGYSQRVPRIWLLTAALVFMLGGVTTGRLQHVSQIISYSWLPVLIWMLLVLTRNPTKLIAIIFGVILGFWAANPNQIVFLGSMLLLSLGIYKVVSPTVNIKLAVMYLVVVATALVIIAPIYAAMFEVIGISERDSLSIAPSAWSSFPWHVFLSIFMPGLYGNLGGTNWSPTDTTQDYLYIGILPIIALAVGCYMSQCWKRTIILVWALGLILFVLFSVGMNSPFYPFVWNHVPGFSFFRRPADGAYFINLMIVFGLILVGREVFAKAKYQNNLTAVPGPQSWRKRLLIALSIFIVPFVCLALGAAAGSEGASRVVYRSYGELLIRVLVFWVFFLSVIALVSRRHRLLPVIIMTGMMLLTLDLSLAGRYFGGFTVPYVKHPLGRSYRTVSATEFETLDHWLRENTAPGIRVEVIGGLKSAGHSSKVQWYNTQGSNPIHLSNYAKKLGAYETLHVERRFPVDSKGPMDWRYDVLGLDYVAFYSLALKSEINHPVNSHAKEYLAILAQNGAEQLYADSEYEVWSRPSKNLWLAMAHTSIPGNLTPAPCELKEYRNASLEIHCEFDESGRLVIGEIYAPGWTACVNEMSVKVEPYFDVFRSLELTEGKSRIELRYQPVPFLRSKRC